MSNARTDEERADLMSRREQDRAFCAALMRAVQRGDEHPPSTPLEPAVDQRG